MTSKFKFASEIEGMKLEFMESSNCKRSTLSKHCNIGDQGA